VLNGRAVTVGDALPPFTRQTTIESWNRFAAVNDEFIPIHMDDEAGQQAGNPAGAFGMGNLRLSYLMNLLRDWCGDEGDIRAVDVRYTALNQKGDVLTAVGTVRDVKEGTGELVVTIDVDVLNQEQVSTAPGRAVVAFPASGAR
jgi:acyl dehydratase